jgi:hypothetical protein
MDHTYIPQTVALIIAENCPRAISAYLICQQYADKENFVMIDRAILDDKSMSWTRFCNDIKSLARQGLLEWSRDDEEEVLKIILAEYEL